MASGAVFDVPVRCDGSGQVRLGAGAIVGYPFAPCIGDGKVLLQARKPGSFIEIGQGTVISNNACIVANMAIEIGKNCLLGDSVSIYDSDFHEIDPMRRHSGNGVSQRVLIGDNVWIGSRAIVLKGVKIGDNAIVGAGSIVTTTIPENTLAAGVPAKVIRLIG